MKTVSEVLKEIQRHAEQIRTTVRDTGGLKETVVDAEAYYILKACYAVEQELPATTPPTPYVPWPTEPGVYECKYQGNRQLCLAVDELTDNSLCVRVGIWTFSERDYGAPTNFLRCHVTVLPVAEPEKAPERPAEMAAMSAIVDALNAAPKESHERMLKYINARFQTT